VNEELDQSYSSYQVLKCEPFGGWGNRLLTISSLYRIAKIRGLRFELGWASMPGVMDEPPLTLYKFPFPVYRLSLPPQEPDQRPNKAGRFFLDESHFNGGSLRMTGSDSESFYHCLWLGSDLLDLTDSKVERLTREICQCLREILIPESLMTDAWSGGPLNDRKSLGVHLRVAIDDDYKKGIQFVWPDLDIQSTFNLIVSCAVDSGADTIFVVSPNKIIEKSIHDLLKINGFDSYCSQSIPGYDLMSADERMYFEFYFLSNCISVFRRAASTFSATASLAGSRHEYILLDDYRVVRNHATLFCGFGL
jgi:hypothetical protein